MKKFSILFLVFTLIFSTTAFAGMFEGNFSDPFNNELFEVVTESTYYDDFNMDFVIRDLVYNEDFTQAKAVETVIYYNGNHETRDLCDFTDSSTAYGFIYEEYSEDPTAPSFNDGLTRAGEEDGCWIGGLKDINNTVKFMNGMESYYSYSYNLGLLHEVENNGYADPDLALEDREYKTTFTQIMTDNKKYEFNCNIGSFNDDGYALMSVGRKGYVIKLKQGIIPTVFYNDKKISFDQIPVIENGRTLVPLRAIFETFGAEVNWDGNTRTVTATKDGIEVKLTIDNTTAYKNGEAITLDVPAKIVNGRTLVPVRFVSDCFDVQVEWDGVMRRVNLTK